MSKRKEDEAVGEKKSNYAFLVAPAKDLVENFSIDVLKALTGYLEAIQRADAEAEANPSEIFQFFDFAEASRIVEASARVYSKKVDHVYQLTLSVMDMIENKEGADGNGGRARGARGRRIANYGSTGFDLIDVREVRREALQNYEKAEREEKKAIDSLRIVDNAEIAEAQYERKSCLIEKPTQFMFKLDNGQLQRANEQIQNAKARPDVIGKVKDFYIKKADVIHEQEVLISHDDYKKNVDQFTLPGARWIPDNKELAANFGVADIEVELDREQEKEQINAYGPFKDPLTGREVVAPPRWFIEQEATRQHLEIQSRSTSRAASKGNALRDSQAYGSQGTLSQRNSQRNSQPFVERHRNNLNEFVSFVEGRIAKNRPSTHLNAGLVDMFVDNFGDVSVENHQNPPPVDMDYDDYDNDFGGGGADDDNDENSNDYVRNLTRRVTRPQVNPWDDLEKVKIPMYTGDEDIPVTRKPVKVIERIPPKPSTLLKRKQAREAKIPKSRRDEFMETHDYLQDFYYWRSAARINPNKDWKVEALRTMILGEKKRKCREKTRKIQEIRAQNLTRKRSNRRNPMEDYEPIDVNAIDEMDDDYDGPNRDNDAPETGNRRTMGSEYKDFVDEDLQNEVELEELGGGIFDDYDYDPMDPADQIGEPGREALPMPDLDFDAPPPAPRDAPEDAPRAEAAAAPYRPMMFEDIDDAELNSVINLPGSLFFDKALPLLKKFAEHKTDREQMAYEMAKAYEDVDVAVSTLQEQVDKWHQRMEPILDEGETRKEYDVHAVGRRVIDEYAIEGETKRLIDLCLGRPWYEISRYFLSCLFMCNMGNVMVEDDKTLSLEDRINSMKITLLDREMHSEKMDNLMLDDAEQKK